MGRNLVCLCSVVLEEEILEALKKGAKTTADIQKYTTAGTTCGRCLPQIDQLVEDYYSTDENGPQFKLDL